MVLSEQAKANKLARDMERYHKLKSDEFSCDDCGKLTNKQHYKSHCESMYHNYAILMRQHDTLQAAYIALYDNYEELKKSKVSA